MRFPYIFLLPLIILLNFSCKTDDTSSSETISTEETIAPPVMALPPSANVQEPSPFSAPQPQPSSPSYTQSSQPSTVQRPLPVQQVQPQPAPNQNTRNQGPLNPPHGQPGHRCDIAVGAPLSSAPKVAQQVVQPTVPQVNEVQPATTTPTLDPANTVTAPGMNPPHGQPGHKCEIPVGAPLPTE